MTAPLPRFHAYEIAEDPAGASLELSRTDHEVVCLASLPAQLRWVELHVLTTVDTLDPASQPTAEAFRARVQSLRRLAGRRLPEILEAGEDEGALFYVSAFIDGEPLEGYLARCAPVPPWWAIEIARQLTHGLLAVRDTPDLLARVRVSHARLALEGEATTDAVVTLADFDLGAPPECRPTEPAAAETRAVTEIGRLLGRALGIPPVDQMNAAQRSALPLPAEVVDLVCRLLARPGHPVPRDLPRLLQSLNAAALSPSLATAPPRLPPTLRPRLPLAAHFPGLPRLTTEIGTRLRLERTPFDAAHPYAQLAFEGMDAVTVQLLPPPRLLSPGFLPAIRRAAAQASARPSPHLLRVLEVPARDDAGWFLEEGAPRITLERARRLRHHFTPTEAAFLLQLCDQAVLAIEARGLPPAAVAPAELFFDFATSPENHPGDDTLASQPVHAWPPFKIKMRAHPTATHLAQPPRFRRERLLDPAPLRLPTDPPPAPPDGLGSPSAADYAALFTWMCGGLTAVPRELTTFLTATLHDPTTTTRAAVVDAVLPFLPRPPATPAAPAPAPATSAALRPPDPTPTNRQPDRPTRRRHSRPQSPRPTPKPAAPATPFIPPDDTPRRGTRHEPDDTPHRDTPDEPGGFAEILLADTAADPPVEHPLLLSGVPDDDLDDANADLPIGTLFGHSGETDPDFDDPSPPRGPTLHFGPRTRYPDGPSRWRLVILVIIISLLIAIVMAHVTGLGFWR